MKSKTAVVLMNMGAPQDKAGVRQFLFNMFRDPAILQGVPGPIRLLIAYLVSRLRLNQAWGHYRLLGGKSPLLDHMEELATQLKTASSLEVFSVLRYNPPFASMVVERLKAADYRRVVGVPLYPHWSATTTGSSSDDLKRQLVRQGYSPEYYEIGPYYDDPAFNALITAALRKQLGSAAAQEYLLIFSAHSLPEKITRRGDPYQEHVSRQVNLLTGMLAEAGMRFGEIMLAYQSRLGPLPWLKPYLSDVLERSAGKKIIIYPISFTLDNLETSYELSLEYRDYANSVGVSDYQVVPAMNASVEFAQFLAGKIRAMAE